MNESDRPFLYRTALMDREIFLFNFIRIEYLTNLRGFYYTLVAFEAFFCALSMCVSLFLVTKALQNPPMHINPCLITAYDVIITVMSNGARIGQILYESGEHNKEIPTLCVVLSFIRFYGLVSVGRYSVTMLKERSLALRYVRDYEINRRIHIAVIIILIDVAFNTTLVLLLMLDVIPFYRLAWLNLLPIFGVYFAFNRLLAQNEKRLDCLNQRTIRRPSIQGGLEKSVKKFFGDSAKDMYTLSLRLQLDENIWCCKQLSRGSYIFMVGITTVSLIEIIPPMFSYTRETISTLMIIMSIGNLVIPIAAILMHTTISWSLDKLRPLIVPAFVYNWHEKRRKGAIIRSKRVTTESQIAPDSDSRYSRETNEYFDQLSGQWSRSFDSLYI